MEKETKNPQPQMHRGPGSMMKFEKPKNFSRSLKKLIKYLFQYKYSFLIVFVFAVSSTAFSVVSPKILGNVTNTIVDDYINMVVYDKVMEKLPPETTFPDGTKGEVLLKQIPEAQLSNIPSDQQERLSQLDISSRPTIQFDSLKNTFLILIVLYLISAVFGYIQGWIMAKVAQNITYKLRKEIALKINKLPLKYFDKHSYGDVLSHITNDVDSIGQTLNQSLVQIITSIAMVIGILTMMLTISLQLTIIAILVIPVSMVTIALIVKNSQKLFQIQQESLGALNGHIEEMYAGHNVVKAYNGEDEAIETFKSINTKLHKSAWKSQFISGLMMPIITFIGNLGYVAVAITGGWLAYNNKIKIGDIQAFFQYLQQFNQPVRQTANIVNVLQSTIASAERVFEFLEEDEERMEIDTDSLPKKIKGHVKFENVVFSYDKDETIIHNFSAEAKPGQRVAIVGPTGAGKTTMVNLLMRFYELDSGKISIDGVDISKVKRAELRKLFGMVLQDTWLFNGSIRDNIAYGKQYATQKEIIKAAKAAQVDHFVKILPKGYDLKLNENADNISQGEKQLLTIARAMLANPPILILDEATSSVDTRTEVLIQKAMDKLMEDRTSFIIAHRLSTIKNADLIIVMDKGDIVEQGTHDQLMKIKGFYAKLYNSQFEE